MTLEEQVKAMLDALRPMLQQDGGDLNIAFNVKYLTDVVRFIDADQIEINLNSPIAPCIITPVGDHDYVHLVLPVRTGATN
jgi:DNA polymerase-3 subunit beta